MRGGSAAGKSPGTTEERWRRSPSGPAGGDGDLLPRVVEGPHGSQVTCIELNCPAQQVIRFDTMNIAVLFPRGDARRALLTAMTANRERLG